MELEILHLLQCIRSSALDLFMVFITTLGNHGQFWILLTIIFIIFDKKDRKCGWHMALALLFSLLVCNIFLKNLVVRERPCWIDPSVTLLIDMPKDYSFPSGHSSASIAGALSLFFHHRRIGAAMLVLAAFIAFSRLYLFVHWPTDVLGGLIIGIICALSAGKIIKVFYVNTGEK